MPWYRIHGLMVHMRGTKLPAACEARATPKNPIVPGRRFCLAPSGFACDWPLDSGKTCDVPLCSEHARQVGTDRHYCPPHYREWLAREPQLFA